MTEQHRTDEQTTKVHEDHHLLKTAATIGRSLEQPNPLIYWSDLLTSAGAGYASLFLLLVQPLDRWSPLFAMLSLLLLYRAESFIHELTHVSRGRLPCFHGAWNILVGIPLLTPSFLYEGVHNLHHSRTVYGTSRDPEYLPLAGTGRARICIFLLSSTLAPFALLIRFALLGPLSLLHPSLRGRVIVRMSALAINPGYRRAYPDARLASRWRIQEAATTIWSWTLIGVSIASAKAMQQVLMGLLLLSAIALLNQLRTLVAHSWSNSDGTRMNLTEQYLDSVNIPPPAIGPALWAPVGLRYHALHHLLPAVPYHHLPAAYREISRLLGRHSTLSRADYAGWKEAIHSWW
ncbi:MAG: fatty acid desaturase [Pseudomonadota bacterium]